MAKVTVVFPICLDTDKLRIKINKKRIAAGDEDYIEDIRRAIKDSAEAFLMGASEAIITESDIIELVE